MNLCPNCGVDLGDDARSCPLCGVRVGPGSDKPESKLTPLPHIEPLFDPDGKGNFTPHEKLFIMREVVTVCLAIAAGSAVAINFLVSGSITWAFYPVAAIVFIWLCVGLPLYLPRHPGIVLAAAAIGLLGFLGVLDLIDGPSTHWFLPLGLPLALACEVFGIGTVLAVIKARRKGLNIVSIILFGVTAICLSIEYLTDKFLHGEVHLEWSSIVAFALMPVGIFLVYIHLRVATTTSLRKFFHV
jgi:hypothetical protein